MDNTKYKNTDIGMLPSEWEVNTFSNYATIERGGSPRPIEKYLTNSVNGVNWIKIGDVAPNDKYITKTKEKIIRDGIIHSREVKEGDFILSNSMSFGRPYILKIDGCIHDGWLVIKDFNGDFDKDFLYYLLSSDSIQNQYVGLVAGSGVKNLNKDIVKKVLVLKPKNEEQQKIATSLTHIDNLINDYEKLIVKKEAIKKGMMQELLTGRRRLKGYDKKWAKIKIGELVDFYKGSGLSKEKLSTNGKNKCILYGELFTTYGDLIDCVYSKTNFQEGMKSKINDILIPGSTTTLGIDLVKASCISVDGVLLGGDINILRPKKDIDGKFVSMLISYVYNFEIAQYTQGVTVFHLSAHKIKNVEIMMPEDIKEQQAISAIILNHKNQIDNLNIKLNKLKSLKKSMMSNLLTGKIRL